MSAPDKQAPAGDGYIPSSPVFFRMIRRAMAAFIAAVCVLAAFIPAPLQEPGNIAKAPNPAKSAWFLLWIQELVGYTRHSIWLVVAVAFAFLALPYTRLGGRGGEAEKSRRIVAAAALFLFAVIVALTVIAYFFRGRNWGFSAHP